VSLGGGYIEEGKMTKTADCADLVLFVLEVSIYRLKV